MRQEFIQAIRSNEANFGLGLSEDKIQGLADYFELVQEHNPILHLVAPCSPEEFATRHALESLTMLEFVPEGARFADVGAGAGLPSIPCLIARDDLSAVLIESKEKKAAFLQKALSRCGLTHRAEIIARQFSEVARPHVGYVTCRALDRFAQKLPQLLKWCRDSTVLFFGGPDLLAGLKGAGLNPTERLMPLSERRYLYVAESKMRRR